MTNSHGSLRERRTAFIREFGAARVNKLKHIVQITEAMRAEYVGLGARLNKTRDKLKELKRERDFLAGQRGIKQSADGQVELQMLGEEIAITEAAIASINDSIERVSVRHRGMIHLKQACYDEIKRRYALVYTEIVFQLVEGGE